MGMHKHTCMLPPFPPQYHTNVHFSHISVRHAAASHEIRNSSFVARDSKLSTAAIARHACLSMVQELLSFSEGSQPHGGLTATAACAVLPVQVLCCPYNTINRECSLIYMGIVHFWGTAHRQAPGCLHVSAKFAVQC